MQKERENQDFTEEQIQDNSRAWECQPGWKNSLNPTGITQTLPRSKVAAASMDATPGKSMDAKHQENPLIPPSPSLGSIGKEKEKKKTGKPGKIQLTNIGLFVGFDDFRQLKIPCNDGHLEKRRKTGMSGSGASIWMGTAAFHGGKPRILLPRIIREFRGANTFPGQLPKKV